MQQPIQVSYRFDYFHETDKLQFSFQLGQSPVIQVVLPADAFFLLCKAIVLTGQPFLEGIKRARAEGIKQDAKVEFNMGEWEKKMKEGGEK